MTSNDNHAIYLHIPFCATKCSYCAFNTYVDMETLIPTFVNALCEEIQLVAQNAPKFSVHTLYFGGGTPSLLTPSQFESILDSLFSNFKIIPNAEISLEANPNDLSYPYLKDLREVGFNRISIGMQSAIERDLRLFERRHNAQTVNAAVSAARQAGFDNLSLDLIYGIPYQSLEDWRTTLQRALALSPAHLSLYALTLEGGTPLKDAVDARQVPSPDDDLAADMYDLAAEMLAAAGLEQYEISNWAKSGYQSRHNLQYWYNLPYLGLGPGAHGFAGQTRYSVLLSPQKYIARLQQTERREFAFPRTPATARAVTVDRQTEISETLMMTLRLTQEGVNRKVFHERFGADLLNLHGQTIDRFAQLGLLEVTDEYVRLTPRGRLLSNVVLREFV